MTSLIRISMMQWNHVDAADVWETANEMRDEAVEALAIIKRQRAERHAA